MLPTVLQAEEIRLVFAAPDMQHVRQSADCVESSEEIHSNEETHNDWTDGLETKGLEHDILVQKDEENHSAEHDGHFKECCVHQML